MACGIYALLAAGEYKVQGDGRRESGDFFFSGTYKVRNKNKGRKLLVEL
jgi:hypothetical protein